MSVEYNREKDVVSAALGLLGERNIPIPDRAVELLERHADLVRQWNRVCGLVSTRDEMAICFRHTCDSIGLVAAYHEVCPEIRAWMDIGSGGGFPALPVALLLPELAFVLFERSRKKHAFLERAVWELGLGNRVMIRQECFPENNDLDGVRVYTARAVEKPEQVQEVLARAMTPGSVYLCQGKVAHAFGGKMFHVEQYRGDWPWRRGDLFIVRRTR